MAVHILPILKAVAPYVAQITSAAIPAFTSKSADTLKRDPVLAKQIQELQTAATQNAQSIHVLAEKLQQTIQGMEIAAQEAQKQAAIYRILLLVSFGMSGCALLLSLVLLLR